METDEFCLRWNNHHSVFISVLNSLLQKELLVDVTLAADGQYIEVHRLVLCACSKYFEDLLSTHKKKQSIIFLSNVTITDLKAIVEYMYTGEVNVTQEQLPRFLAAAEILKIKGLADKTCKETSPSSLVESLAKRNLNTEYQIKDNFSRPCTSKTKVPSNVYLKAPVTPQPVSDFSYEESQMITEAKCDDPFTLTTKTEVNVSEELTYVIPTDKEENYLTNYLINNHEVLSCATPIEQPCPDTELIDSPSTHQLDITRNDERVKKPTTPLSTVHKRKKKNMASSVSLSLCTGCSPVNCPSCGRNYKSKGSLNRHRKFECGQEPAFSCPICLVRFKRKDKLKDHHDRHHRQDSPLDNLVMT